jgi:hypothetical protein
MNSRQMESKKLQNVLPLNSLLFLWCGILFGALVASGIMTKDVKFRAALESRVVNEIYSSSKNTIYPQPFYLDSAAAVFLNNKVYDLSKLLAETSLKINPVGLKPLLLLVENPELNKEELIEVQEKLRELDPNYFYHARSIP